MLLIDFSKDFYQIQLISRVELAIFDMFRKQERPSSFVVPKQGAFSQSYYNPSLISGKLSNADPQPRKASQVVRPQETVAWGFTKGENMYETSYRGQFRDNSASKIPQRAVQEPVYYSGQLSGSLIPCGTPKFTRGKRLIEPSYLAQANKTVDLSPVSKKKQFNEIKHKEDYSKNHSLLSHREFSRTPSPNSHSRILKDLCVHHSQVQENFKTEPTTPADLSADVSLYCKTLDDSKAAGVSSIKRKICDDKYGRRHAENNRSPGVKDVLKSCDEDIIQPASLIRKELKSTFTKPVQALALRTSENLESYISKNGSPSGTRCGSPFSRRSFSPIGVSPRRSITPEVVSGSISARERVTYNRITKNAINTERLLDRSADRSRASTPRIPAISYKELKAEQEAALSNPASKNYRPSRRQRAQTPTILNDGSYSARGEAKKMQQKPSTPVNEKPKTNISKQPPPPKVTRSKLPHPKPGVFSGINKKYSGLP